MVRRVVTGFDGAGAPVVVSDGPPPRSADYVHTPGFAKSLVWATSAPPAQAVDPTEIVTSFLPRAGESIALVVTFPPDSVFAEPGFDFAAAGAEQAQRSPGLAELFEPDAPGMHTTPTIDYGVVIEGEVVLDLDGGNTALLRAGDIIVQNSTRHAWRNPSDRPAKVFFVLMGTADAP
jgi:hypothetical protein